MRFSALDSWRGIAALMVALFHLPVAGHLYPVPLVRHGFLFVDFFFVLSGFVISHAYAGKLHSARDYAGFLIRRFGRLWPLHVAVLGAWIGLEGAKHLATGSGFDPAGATDPAAIPSHMLLTHALGQFDKLTWNGQSWSISAEFWMYVLFGAAAVFLGSWRTAVLIALAVASAAVIANFSSSGIEVTYDLGFLRCVYGFTVGYLVYQLHNSTRAEQVLGARGALPPWLWEALAVALVVAFVAVAGRGTLSLAAPFVFAVPVLIFAREQGPLSRWLNAPSLQALGRWSYSIYMVHGIVVYALALAVYQVQRSTGAVLWAIETTGTQSEKLVVANPWLLDLVWLGYAAGIIGMSAVTYRWIEEPGRAWFAKLASRMQEGPRSPAPVRPS